MKEKIFDSEEKMNKINNRLKLNRNFEEELSNLLKDYKLLINPLIDITKELKIKLSENICKQVESFVKLNESNIFKKNYSFPQFPEKVEKLNIYFSNLNCNSEDLCVPLTNFSSQSQELICSHKQLNIYLGEVCPYYYDKPIIIKIISFIKNNIHNSIHYQK